MRNLKEKILTVFIILTFAMPLSARADDYQMVADWLKTIKVQDGSTDYTAEKLKTIYSLRLAVKKEVTDAEIEKYVAKLTSLHMLSLDGTNVTNAGLAFLKPLVNLDDLDLGSLKGVTGAGLVYLKDLPNLKNLNLQSSGITGADLETLATTLPNLTKLSLSWLKINAGVASLAKMTKLEEISFFHSDLDDTGIKSLAPLTNLKKLFVWGSPITDAGLATVAKFTNLKTLYISDTKITDKGMQSLKGLQQLDYLWLDKLPISDAGLMTLASCKALTTVYAPGTQITDAGIVKFNAILPKAKVRNK